MNSRYARQEILPEVGREGQARLAAGRVLVVGAGGLGATVLPALSGAGVGRLRLVDPDRVSESNLHRQWLFTTADLGRRKVDCAAARLAAINPEVSVEPLPVRLDPATARAATEGIDLVIDAADSFAVSYTLSDLCHARGLPLVSASVLGRSGHVGGFCGGGASFRAVFPEPPALARSCANAGVLGPAVACLGALQAQMALAVLLGLAPSPLGQMLTVDLANWRISSFRFDKAQEPDAPGPAILSVGEVGPGDVVIELRDDAEAPVAAVPQALRMAPDDIAAFAPAPGTRVVFACATGVRAWHAAKELARRWPNQTAILAAAP